MENNDYVIEMENITKIFNDTIVANDNINLKIKRGEVHALLGENGAGKSTLMSMLFGFYSPTSGTIKINGIEVRIENSIKAKRLGIGMIHQHFKLIDNFSVWANIALGNEITKFSFIKKNKICKKIEEIMNKYNLHLDLNKKVKKLSVCDQQKIEIIRILYNDANILIFDEPTAVLSLEEIKSFFKIIENLQKEGKTIIFISHKLHEIKEISNNVTIMNKGKLISTFPLESKSMNKIAQLMVGRKVNQVENKHTSKIGETVLKISDLSIVNKKINYVKNISLEIKAGEILAIAGVSGSGQNYLLDAIAGLSKIKNGSIKINNKKINNIPTYKRYLKDLSYVPEDRQKIGLILEMNVIENIMLQNMNKKPFVKNGIISFEINTYYAQNIIKNYQIHGTDNGYAITKNLSGGNQQKIIIGRELNKEHNLLLVSQPTRGVDVGAIEYIHEQLLEAKNNGNAILLVSFEIEEILSLADRIVVISHGEIIGELKDKEMTKENIGLLMLGKRKEKQEDEEK